LSDAASTFIGSSSDDGKSTGKLVASAAGPLKYTTASRTAFTGLFVALNDAETTANTQTFRTVDAGKSITWSGTRWSVPE
jgi:hypothetical protein